MFLGQSNGWWIWDTSSGEVLHELNRHQGGVRAGVFSADDENLLTGGSDGVVLEWKLSDESTRSLLETSGPISFVSYLNNENSIIAVNESGTVYLVNRENGEIQFSTAVPHPVISKDDVELTLDEKYLFIENQILDLKNQRWLKPFGNYDIGDTKIVQIKFSPNETWLAVRTDDGIVRAWDQKHIFGNQSNIDEYTQY